jgi:hypothetical protein
VVWPEGFGAVHQAVFAVLALDLALEERLAVRREGGVLGGDTADPARGVEVGQGEGVAAPLAQGEVEQGGAVRPLSQTRESSPSRARAASREVATTTGPCSGRVSIRAPSSRRAPRFQARAAIRSMTAPQPPTGYWASGGTAATRRSRSWTKAAERLPGSWWKTTTAA